MIRTLPSSRSYRWSFHSFIILYFVFLFAPLAVTCVLAFNDSNFPGLPWNGFSLDWFVSPGPERVGFFHDDQNLRAMWTSFQTAVFVALFSVVVGTCAAFLFEQEEFPFKGPLYFLMLAPLVIPGVILGISILLAANTAGQLVEDTIGWDLKILRPSFWLVVLGQFSFHQHLRGPGGFSPAQKVRPIIGRSGPESGGQSFPGHLAYHAQVPAAGHHRLGRGGLSDEFRKLQHHPLSGGFRTNPSGQPVPPGSGRQHPGHQRHLPLS